MGESHKADLGSNMITIGRYLARRLRQCGVDHLFGLPGDFNLALLDEMCEEIEWVGSTNELNAAYAADGYSRRRGLAAIVTTYGVGELSALNGIAGAAAESVPVIQITGSPSTTAAQAGSLLHHTLVDGDFDRFARVYQEVTVAGATLTSTTAVAQIDHVIGEALREKKPGYLSIPVDVAAALVSETALSVPLETAKQTPDRSLRLFSSALEHAICGTVGDVVLIVGHLAVRDQVRAQIAQLADSGKVMIATLLDAKGYLDEAHPASLGTYIGALTSDDHARSVIEGARLVITIGTVLSDLLTGMFTDRLGEGKLIAIGRGEASIDGQLFTDVSLTSGVSALASVIDSSDLPSAPSALRVIPRAICDSVFEAGGPLTQSQLWKVIGDWLPSGSSVIADAGTAFYGAAGLHMAGGTELIGQPIWSSIGYTLPATLGVALAGSRRPILIIGDGSAQLTIQELATFAGRGLSPVVILINNSGYTVERAIRSPYAAYQDVTSWDWPTVVAGLLPEEATVVRTARTSAELELAFAVVDEQDHSLAFIEVVTDAHDLPPLLSAIGRGLNSSATAVSA